MEYVKFSSEEIEKARNIDIMDFLSRNYGFEFQKAGKDYRCKQHDSLNIFSDRHGWKWYSKDIGGANAIDFMMRIERKSICLSLSNEKTRQRCYFRYDERKENISGHKGKLRICRV